MQAAPGGTRAPLESTRRMEGRTRTCHLSAPTSLLATPAQGSPGMTILYRGPGARITHEVFEAHVPYPQSYVIRELRYVHVIRETAADVAVGSAPFRVCSTALTGISAAFTVAG